MRLSAAILLCVACSRPAAPPAPSQPIHPAQRFTDRRPRCFDVDDGGVICVLLCSSDMECPATGKCDQGRCVPR